MSGAPPPPPPPPPPGGVPPPVPPPGGQPGPPGQPFGQHGATPTGTNGMAIAALVLGILSIPLCFFVIPPVLAIVFGAIGVSQTKASGQKGRGMAITGLVLGAIALAIFVLAIVVASSTSFYVGG